MKGERLVSHLRLLKVPGAEHLDGDDYEWLFLADDTIPLALFLEWFAENVSANDVLTEEDLNEFEELKSRGEVLTGYHLERLDSCLSGLPAAFATSEEEGEKDVFTEEECKRLEGQLKILKNRKSQLSTHKIELWEELYKSSEHLKEMEVLLKNHQEGVLNTSCHLTKAQEELAKSLDSLTNVFLAFDKTPADEVKFFCQLDLDEWYQVEAKFTDSLKTYVRKQFKEGVKDVAGVDDSSEYCLLDVSNMDLQLVRGAGNAEYAHNVGELKRLEKLLRQTEEWKMEGLLLQDRRRAEIEEANRQFAAIHRSQLSPNLALLQQQAREAGESTTLVERERQQQQQVMHSLIKEVVELECARTISGNYKLKRQRQEYFLNKQKIVMDELVTQMARYSLINLILDIERDQIADILMFLQSISSVITQKDVGYQKRMSHLQGLTKEHGEHKASGQLPLPLMTLSHLLAGVAKPQPKEEQIGGPVTGKYLQKQVAMLQKDLDVGREQVSTTRNPQFSRLNRMTMKCVVLETRLFGSPGCLRTLPAVWLEPELADRYFDLDQELENFKQKLMVLKLEYEEKKKVLQIDPTVREDYTKWLSAVVKVLTRV
nr:HAUS augmin-like complex subunit 3 [Procambarus clarkii]XP_045595903.1 HAUS augmin-like complex subunit 3 [Procambarus clarkii]XP_045595904.1 HAUS augmin-like complex subunit 3 [Procambarus clarkii]